MSCFFLLILLGNLPLSTKAVGQQSTQSDVAAVQALRNVVLQSGGEAAWGGLTSAKESFSVVSSSSPVPLTTALLDDWSLGTTRYRRKTEGQRDAPVDHNGTSTFSWKSSGATRTVHEFDQPRILAGHLPAAAALILLRGPGYVFKMSKTQACGANLVCIEVYRLYGSTSSPVPEELWAISPSTGLPIRIRYRAVMLGVSDEIWSQASFLKYSPQQGVVVPVSIETSFAGRKQMWTFVSLEENPGFDPAKFDSEVGK